MRCSNAILSLRSRYGRKAFGRWLLRQSVALVYPDNAEKAYVAARYGLSARLPSDINEHIETLRKYSEQCASIAELGVRGTVSTWAFVSGLANSGAGHKSLCCLDIESIPHCGDLKRVCRSLNIELTIIQGNSVAVDIPSCDLLFIDTWHVAGHLSSELARHNSQARKFIILHDTTTDGEQSEAVRSGADISALSQQTGYSEQEIRQGLMFAVRDFLQTHKDWMIAKQFTNNNGLMVLARTKSL